MFDFRTGIARILPKNGEPRRELTWISRFLSVSAGVLAAAALLFFMMMHIFEQITYNAVADANRDFAISTNALIETCNTTIVNYGRQLYSSNAVKRLFGKEDLSSSDRDYIMRELNSTLNAADFTEAVYVLNGYTNTVYSTGPLFQRDLEELSAEPIRELLTERDSDRRFEPIYCHEDGDEERGERNYYAFMFYELYPDRTPKPNALLVTINSDWYQNFLLLANPSSDLIVLDQEGEILLSANEYLKTVYQNYYPQIEKDLEFGYLLNKKKGEICMFYQSPSTRHMYLRVASVRTMIPQIYRFRQMATRFIVGLGFLFLMIVAALTGYSLFPMMNMRKALKHIDTYLTGENESPDSAPPAAAPQLSLKEQLDNVVTKSQRTGAEQALYDMLSRKRDADASRLFGNLEGPYGVMLVLAQHRRDIYGAARLSHPELLVTKSDNLYACIGQFSGREQTEAFAAMLAEALGCRVFVSGCFSEFDELTAHFQNLKELWKLSLMLKPEAMIIKEEELKTKSMETAITTRDFTELTVRLKSGNLELSTAKWQEMLAQMSQYRYDALQYVLRRAEDTVCGVLKDIPSALPGKNEKLLPEELEQVKSIDEINDIFQKAFAVICEEYSKQKAERYSQLARQVKEIVRQQYHDPALNAQNIADRLQMNNTYLGRLFRSSYGHSINDYINTCRLEESKLLLTESDESIETIAHRVGFSNTKYYYVLFKKHTGQTPATYRSSQTS